MKITKIEIQKKNKNRVNIYADNEFVCGLSSETVLKNHIKEGQDITLKKLDYLKNETEKEIALNKALNYLTKSPKTKKEIFNYLLKKGFEQEIAEQTILKLQEYNYVNDALYAQNFVKYKTKNSGRKKIEYELKQKGINDNIIKQKIDEFSDDEKQVFLVINKYLKNKSLTDIKTKQKAFRYLLSKGFSLEVSLNCLNKILKNKKEDDNDGWN